MALVVVAAGALVAVNALDGLTLVQLKAERSANFHDGASSKGNLPDVARLLQSKTFSDVKLKIGALERRVGEALRRDEAKIVQQREELEGRLTRQRQDNGELERANAETELRAKRVTESNAALRRRARDLAKANDELRSELKGFHANLTLAQEFLEQGLTSAENEAPEVHVLAELAELDEKKSKLIEKQARLNEIGGSSMSLLDSSRQEHGRTYSHRQAKESPEVLMQHVMAHLEELSEEEHASETSLQKAFDEKFQIETRKHAALLEEQVRLNSSTAEIMALHDRLSAALKHLAKVHEQLVARISAVKKFAQRLGTSNLGDRTPRVRATSVRVPRRQDGRQGKGESNASNAVAHVSSRRAVVGATQNISEARGRKHLGTTEGKTPTAVVPLVAAAADKPSKDNATSDKDSAKSGHGNLAALFPKWMR